MGTGYTGPGGGNASLTAPLQLPATVGNALTTQGGNTLDDGAGNETTVGTSTFTGNVTMSSTASVAGTLILNGVINANATLNTRALIYATGGYKNGGVTVSSPAVTSGTAFTPAANDSIVYVQLNAAAAGTVTFTMGPTTGAEHTVASSMALVAGSDELLSVRVPGGWKAVVTVVTATIASVLVVTA